MQIASLPEWWSRSRDLLSIEPRKVQEGTGAANDANFKERYNYIVLVTTLITTVTFAAAFQVPGGYDDKGKPILLNNKRFKYFLIFDSLAFVTSIVSLFIYFGMPLLQRLAPAARYAILQLEWYLSMVSLLSMFLAFPGGITAVLDKKSSLNSIAGSTVALGWAVPLYLFIIIAYIFIFRGYFRMIKIRQLIS